jgi:hypothetical protein
MPQPAWLLTQTVVRPGVAHEHRLDQRAVVPAPQGLAGGALVAVDLAHDAEQRRQQVGAQPLAQRGGQVGHLLRAVPGEVVAAQLLGAEGLLPQLLDGGPAPARSRSARWRGGRPRLGASKTRGRAVTT